MKSIDTSAKSPASGFDERADMARATPGESYGLRPRAVSSVPDLRARRRQVQSLLPGRAHRPAASDSPQPSGAAVAVRHTRLGGAESKWIDIDGPVHYIDYGGPSGATTIVMVHGLMGAHLNWLALAPQLTDEFRVVALDLVGHGLTERAGRSSDVWTNQRMLHRFLAEVVGEPAVLVGSSMGGLICILQAADEPDSVLGLVLLAAPLPVIPTEVPDPVVVVKNLPLVVPVLGTFLLHARQRTTKAENVVRSLLTSTTAAPDRLSAEVISEHVALEEHRLGIPGASAGLQTAARSTVLTVLQLRDYAARIRAIEAPVLLIQGERDKIIAPSGARRFAARNPHWDFESFPGAGHAVMLDAPEQLAGSIRIWADNRLA